MSRHDKNFLQIFSPIHMTRFSIETQKSRHENFPLYIEVDTIEEVIHPTDIVDNLSINRSHDTTNFPAKRRQ